MLGNRNKTKWGGVGDPCSIGAYIPIDDNGWTIKNSKFKRKDTISHGGKKQPKCLR